VVFIGEIVDDDTLDPVRDALVQVTPGESVPATEGRQLRHNRFGVRGIGTRSLRSFR